MKSKFSECPYFSCSRSDGTFEPGTSSFPAASDSLRANSQSSAVVQPVRPLSPSFSPVRVQSRKTRCHSILNNKTWRFQHKFWFEYQEISTDEWNIIFRNFRKRRQPRELNSVTKFSKINHQRFLFHYTLPLEFPEISTILGFPETFPENFRTIFPCFKSFVIFGLVGEPPVSLW